ncbi:hypothetical protein F7R91_32710 [Streptomyces luteolifulvus]|uniref:Uncharacterized protein n=1 Tax=Streptomyces luteolifulvus TaxID=2615112 RepID=A0A6H9URP9_9ACTN|nr:hypothetical protein [Streptomyces luteolifulvus]KAB1141389.1 hypothetical protein F7R91_32710 [Streptomyces luteolifulvus]
MSAVTIPGALADYVTDQFIGDDETAAVLDAARRGRGRTLVIEPTSPRILHVISRYAESVLAMKRNRAQRDAARLWIKRAGNSPARMVHHFTSTGTAYNHTQTRYDIRDGDVLVIHSEQVVGILVSAYPAAITKENGDLHTLTAPAREIEGGTYAASAEAAEQIARSYGFPLAGEETEPAPYAEGARVQQGNRTGTVTAVNVPMFHLDTQTTTRDNVTIEWDHGTTSTIHPSHVEPANETTEEIEAQQAAAEVTEIEASAGTWRGEWIGEESAGDTLFDVEPAAEQGALFTEGDQPAREAIAVRMTPEPAGLARIRAKAAADREAYRAEMDERQAADHIAHGAPVPAALQARIDARRAEAAAEPAETLPARRVIEGVIVGHAGAAEGSTPADAGHPNVIAARATLDGLAVARMTDHHDVSDPTEAEQDVRGYLVDPREGNRVAVYWLEGGRTIRRDTPGHGPALECLADRLERRGWRVEKMLRSSQCVFAHRPTS